MHHSTYYPQSPRKSTVRALLLWLCFGLLSTQGHPGHETGPAPTETEVVAVIFSDFYSAACGEVNGVLDELASSRHLKIQKLFKHAPSHPGALQAHEASLAAGAQGKFLEMHDLLFKQAKPAGSTLISMARTLGLDLKRFEMALDEREFRNAVLRDIAEAQGLGVKTTPTVYLSGTKIEGLDALRALLKAPARPVQPPWESTPVETLSLDFTGSPTSGSMAAPVTLVEFTDFRCGFCRIHSQVLSELTAAYPGKIFRVFKHYPLNMSAAAAQPHLASLAALDQGKFWELHHSLMDRPVEPGPELVERIKSLGFDVEAFQKSIITPEKQSLIQRDISEGEKLEIRATPTTFLNGRRLVGRQSLESLKKYVDDILTGKVTSPAGLAAVSAAKPDSQASLATFGPVEAPVRIEAFLDLGGRESAAIVAQLGEFARLHPDFRIQFRHFPGGSDLSTRRRHSAAMAAAEQGRFWDMCELMLKAPAPTNLEALKAYARTLSLDRARFEASLETQRQTQAIEADLAEGLMRGLTGSGLFINDIFYQGPLTVKDLTQHLQESNCCGRALPTPAAPANPDRRTP